MRLDVAVEIIADEVVIAMVKYRAAEGGEAACIAEHIGFDGVENFDEIGVGAEFTVVVGVTEIFHVFGEVTEEEDVLVADFSGDFDLEECQYLFTDRVIGMTYVCTIAGTDD